LLYFSKWGNINWFFPQTLIATILVNFGILLLYIWLSNRTLRNKLFEDDFTYSQGLLNSFLTGVMSLTFSSLAVFCFFRYLAPDFVNSMTYKSVQSFQANPNISMDFVDTFKANMALLTPEYIVKKIFLYNLVAICVISLVVSAITKQKPDTFASSNNTEEEN